MNDVEIDEWLAELREHGASGFSTMSKENVEKTLALADALRSRLAIIAERLRLAPDQTPVGTLRDVLREALAGEHEYVSADFAQGIAYDYGAIEWRFAGSWGVLLDMLLETGGVAGSLAVELAKGLNVNIDPKLLQAATSARGCIDEGCTRQAITNGALCLYHLGELDGLRAVYAENGLLPPEQQERMNELARPRFVAYQRAAITGPIFTPSHCNVCERDLEHWEPSCVLRPNVTPPAYWCHPCENDYTPEQRERYLRDGADFDVDDLIDQHAAALGVPGHLLHAGTPARPMTATEVVLRDFEIRQQQANARLVREAFATAGLEPTEDRLAFVRGLLATTNRPPLSISWLARSLLDREHGPGATPNNPVDLAVPAGGSVQLPEGTEARYVRVRAIVTGGESLTVSGLEPAEPPPAARPEETPPE